MNEEQLRALVREEIDAVLDEERRIDSHPKFRRLVEAKAGRKFNGDEDNWDVTFQAWSDAVQESGGTDVDQETLDYYVYVAATSLKD